METKQITLEEDVRLLVDSVLSEWAEKVIDNAKIGLLSVRKARTGHINQFDDEEQLRSSHKTSFKSNATASGMLSDSLRYKIERKEVTFGMMGYGQQVDKGSKPHKVAPKKIEEWIRTKRSFQLKDLKTGRRLPKTLKNIENAAYLIARSIKWHGTSGNRWFSDALKYT